MLKKKREKEEEDKFGEEKEKERGMLCRCCEMRPRSPEWLGTLGETPRKTNSENGFNHNSWFSISIPTERSSFPRGDVAAWAWVGGWRERRELIFIKHLLCAIYMFPWLISPSSALEMFSGPYSPVCEGLPDVTWSCLLKKLRCSLQDINFIILKCPFQWILIYSLNCTAITSILFQNIFICLKRNPMPSSSHSLSPSTPPLVNTNLLPVCMNLPILDISYVWNHTMYQAAFT